MSENTELSVRDWLKKNGATDVQLKSKWLQMVEQAIIDGEVSISKTVQDAVDGIERQVRNCERNVNSIDTHIRRVQGMYLEIERLLQQKEIEVSQITITDKEKLEEVNVYSRVLLATQEVFGKESMTEAVMIKAIEAASYCSWRSMMKQN